MEDAPDASAIDLLTSMTRKKDITDAISAPKHLALMLEIVAEASRNPKVRDILLASQRRAHMELIKRIDADQPGTWPARELDVRVRLISAIQTGVIMQILLDPRAPATAMLKRLKAITKHLLTFEPDAG
jgi:TetR/AcrR family transcriptional regulator, repressor for uid operon